tara:strand:- start:277 stop:426 length:150 start_codon:yes stop_codon:yes gene_type:complete
MIIQGHSKEGRSMTGFFCLFLQHAQWFTCVLFEVIRSGNAFFQAEQLAS